MKQTYSILLFTLLASAAYSSPVNPVNGPATANAQMPLSFGGFYVIKNSGDAVLAWSTPFERNNNNFEIQRSTDGKNWKVVALMLGDGTPATATQYCFTDRHVNKTATRYRIRQVDNSTAAYSIVKNL